MDPRQEQPAADRQPAPPVEWPDPYAALAGKPFTAEDLAAAKNADLYHELRRKPCT